MHNLILTLDEVEPAEAEDDDLRAVHPLHAGWGATKQAPPTHLNIHLLDLWEIRISLTDYRKTSNLSRTLI